ncbi:zinc metalloprotease HtpX [Desulfonatronovibrio hydrogenovorans]|uniref:zinc metalloprotease HtpX n=1 Tax=Desulfonatronovibrio hydrogenovorans TaxID=53245 RepID=UPI00068F26F6|nr:zinc metalloprotease HtpX [Desulfonatronovibrio hydrogenovorans]
MNSKNYTGHKWLNLFHSVLIISVMAGLLILLGWLMAGRTGILWALAAGGVLSAGSWMFSPWPALVLHAYKAGRLKPEQIPALYEILGKISHKAGLIRTPDLYYVPSPAINAFSLGNRKRPVIAVTGGLLEALDLRELQAVLAHEISHIRNNDTRIMNMADAVSRLTGFMALGGQILLLINLPLILMEGYRISWWAIAVLILAPTVSAIMQLALSRTREWDADLDAALLTNDPLGLARALARLEYKVPVWWSGFLFPGRKSDLPSILRTHPRTEDRIKRLISLAQDNKKQTRNPGYGYLALPDDLLPDQQRLWRSPGRNRWF